MSLGGNKPYLSHNIHIVVYSQNLTYMPGNSKTFLNQMGLSNEQT